MPFPIELASYILSEVRATTGREIHKEEKQKYKEAFSIFSVPRDI